MYSKQEVLLNFGISPLTKSVRSAILTLHLYLVSNKVTRPLTSRTLWVISIAEVARGEYILRCSTLVQLQTYNSLKTPTYNTSTEVQSQPKYDISFNFFFFNLQLCNIGLWRMNSKCLFTLKMTVFQQLILMHHYIS